MGILDQLYALVRPMATSVPVVSMTNASDPGDLRQAMRRVVDHPVVKHLPHVAVLAPTLACVVLWAFTQSPGVAIGAALVLYAQLSALSSKHVVASLWATTTLAIRRAVAAGTMSRTDPGDQALVAEAAKAFTVYGFALTVVVPGLNLLVALAVLGLTVMSGEAGAVPTMLLSALVLTLAISAVLTLVPNRIFVRHATTILSRAAGGTQ